MEALVWLRVGMYMKVVADPKQIDIQDLRKQVLGKLDRLSLPQDVWIDGEIYIPDGCIEINGVSIEN